MEGLLIGFMLVLSTFGAQAEYGNLIGNFEDEATTHQITGSVYAVDDVTFYIQRFTFDGDSACAVFYAGNSDDPQSDEVTGVTIPLGSGQSNVLSRPYQTEDLVLTLSANTITDYKWISVRCPSNESFAHVLIPDGFDVPSPKSLGGFVGDAHSIRADDVIALNSKQIKFVGLTYRGPAPGAVFWTGPGSPRDRTSREVPHPPENPVATLPSYQGSTVTITLPDDLTVTDVKFIGIWCKPFGIDFGHKVIDLDNMDDIPPVVELPTTTVPPTDSISYTSVMNNEDLDHCQVLKQDKYHIAWSVDSNNNTITLEFRGLVAINQYMAFGISGSSSRTLMIGSDVTVVWIDPSDSKPNAVDYHLNAYSQCIPNSGRGACPDDLQTGGDDNVELISGTTTSGVTVIRVERPLTPSDSLDLPFDLSGDVYVSWSIGFINPTEHTAKHDILPVARHGVRINFASPSSQCPTLEAPEVVPDVPDPWVIEPMRPEGNATFVATIGPSGGQRGYQGIANQVGWGLVWYINDSIIPEIHVKRGRTYKFMVFGGDDPSKLAAYHPFYISDKSDGGFIQKDGVDMQLETIYAGPIGGTLCEFQAGNEGPNGFDQFVDYKATLTKTCYIDDPQPGVLTWTVAVDTPDLVYYQCYQHRFFGWKIHVSDAVDDTQESPMSGGLRCPQMSSMFMLSMSFIVILIFHQ